MAKVSTGIFTPTTFFTQAHHELMISLGWVRSLQNLVHSPWGNSQAFAYQHPDGSIRIMIDMASLTIQTYDNSRAVWGTLADTYVVSSAQQLRHLLAAYALIKY